MRPWGPQRSGGNLNQRWRSQVQVSQGWPALVSWEPEPMRASSARREACRTLAPSCHQTHARTGEKSHPSTRARGSPSRSHTQTGPLGRSGHGGHGWSRQVGSSLTPTDCPNLQAPGGRPTTHSNPDTVPAVGTDPTGGASALRVQTQSQAPHRHSHSWPNNWL